MRSKFGAAAMACLALAACGGPQTSQANNAQANIDNNAAPPPTANASNAMVLLAVPLPKEKALALMKERHDGMDTISDAFKALHRELGGTPDLATVRTDAAKIAQLSRAASHWFPAGTGPDVAKTRALPQIWQTPDDFAAKLRNFQAAAAAFDAAARGSDVAAMNARFADLGGACKACHDKYRAEEKH